MSTDSMQPPRPKTKRISEDGVPLRSRKHRLRSTKPRGESKAARRIRRRLS